MRIDKRIDYVCHRKEQTKIDLEKIELKTRMCAHYTSSHFVSSVSRTARVESQLMSKFNWLCSFGRFGSIGTTEINGHTTA